MENRYYIVKSDDNNLDSMVKLSTTESVDELRYSLDKTKCIIKLHAGDNKQYYYFKQYQAYTHDEMLEITQHSEWVGEIL